MNIPIDPNSPISTFLLGFVLGGGDVKKALESIVVPETPPSPVFAKREGGDAVLADLSPDANPYPPGSDAYNAWLEGWTDAHDYHSEVW